MARYRQRNASGGSQNELIVSGKISRTDGVENLMKMVKVLLTKREASSGKAFVHRMNDNIWLSSIILLRLQQYGNDSLSRQVLSLVDLESGYNPLHCAVWERSLVSMLLLIRQVSDQSSHRLTIRPFDFLQSRKSLMASAVDAEGMTPVRLLLAEQRKGLRACRQSLRRAVSVIASSRSRQVGSFASEADFQYLSEYGQNHEACNEDDSTKSTMDYGCEVLTFGRAHHCALGIASATAGHTTGSRSDLSEGKVWPRRVAQFAQDQVGRIGGAVAVAGATYHTLVATRDGNLYAFGLGKGGRLGNGSEGHCPLPTRVMGPLMHHKVVGIAAAENHSICVTKTGLVFAWGSNRFGQLAADHHCSRRCSPRIIEDLRGTCCRAVAAGARHSVALSDEGGVYVWGSNSDGQLGVARRNGTHSVQRIESLWSSSRAGIAICASDKTTLILAKPHETGYPVNSVYSCGHGSSLPTSVQFSPPDGYHDRPVNPILISCARHHSVAVTSDGEVYTWGLHVETLGGARASQKTCMTTPQLVKRMLQENGGGFAVDASASESHTAVVTETGELFTWGATSGESVLGHEGLKWQPDPKRVPGVHRAVSVAAAKEHFVLMIGTCFPPTPCFNEYSSLEDLAATKIAQHVDLFNIIPVLTMAERLNSQCLIRYCEEFVHHNLDGVLEVGQRSVMNRYLDEKIRKCMVEESFEEDNFYHPLLPKLACAAAEGIMFDRADLPSFEAWLSACVAICDENRQALLFEEKPAPTPRINERSTPVSRRSSKPANTTCEPSHSCRCKKATTTMNLSTPALVDAKLEELSKEICTVRESIRHIDRLMTNGAMFTKEQNDEIRRRPQLDNDLAAFEHALTLVKDKQKELKARDVRPASSTSRRNYCALCKITAPDEANLRMHFLGKRHRKNATKANEASGYAAAKNVRDTPLRNEQDGKSSDKTAASPWGRRGIQTKVQSSPLPSFRLPPPPHPVGELPGDASLNAPTEKPSLRAIIEEEEGGDSYRPLAEDRKSGSGQKRMQASSSFCAKPSFGMKGSPFSLGDFLPQDQPANTPVITEACQWASPLHQPRWGAALPSTSLLNIQEEEKQMKARKDNSFEDNGRWFIEHRERAGLLTEIQVKEQEEIEYQQLVEEQKAIEAQIARDLQFRAQADPEKKGQGKNRKPKSSDQDFSSSRQKHSRNRKPKPKGRRKKAPTSET